VKFMRMAARFGVVVCGAGILLAMATVARGQEAKPAAGAAAAASTAASNVAETTTTVKDQTDLAVTVYNSNLALVRDVRQIELPAGESRLRFMDIAASINPATVHFRALADPDKLNVLEQDYEYDLLDPAKLLQKYVGREVTLVRSVEKDNSTELQTEQATLLADNEGGPVWKIGDEIVTGMATDSYRFPELPGNLYDRPTLLWLLDNRGARREAVEASYLTTNLSWSADYVLTIGKQENSADLNGWVTLVNNSGTAFENAQLQLVAGEVHRVEPKMGSVAEQIELRQQARVVAPFQQESFSGYHLYTLARRTSIENNESKQISLLSATGFPVERTRLLLPQRGAAGGADQGSSAGFLQIQERRESWIGNAAAGGDRARLRSGFARRGAVYRGRSHRSHAER